MKSLTAFIKEQQINEMLKSPDIDFVVSRLNKEFDKYPDILLPDNKFNKAEYNKNGLTWLRVPCKLYNNEKACDKFYDILSKFQWYVSELKPKTGKNVNSTSLLRHIKGTKSYLDTFAKKTPINGNRYYFIRVEPTQTEDKTDFIYDSCKGIIFHLTDTENVNGILSKGFRLKNSTNRFFTDRIYFTAAENSKKLKRSITTVAKNCKDYLENSNETSIIRIDLNKLNHKIKVYADTVDYYKGVAFYTYEYIPGNICEVFSWEDFENGKLSV